MPADPPPSLAAISAAVGSRIDELLAAEEVRWSAVDSTLAEPFATLRAVAAGGKRLRPSFCHWGFVAAGGSPSSPALLDACAALELLHTMALVHDDIIDDSARRHGLACTHVDFARRHRERGWRGESRRFGDGAAILIGDLAFVYADQLMRGAPAEAIDVFNELRLEVNAGQYLDLVATASRSASLDQARTICVYKSGKYTIERPLHLGAALAGGLDELAEPLSAFGVPLGEAFQLEDDLLGAFGDGSRLGKAVGEDLVSGKPTALYAHARALAPGASILDRYGAPDLTPEEVAAILDVFVTSGAQEAVASSIEALAAAALAALADAPLAGSSRDELAALAAFVIDRDH